MTRPGPRPAASIDWPHLTGVLYEEWMNFLSHSWTLGEQAPALAHVGVALPDLWPHLPVRPLPKVVLARLRVSADQDAASLAHGIAHHMKGDAAFHGHPSFAARVSRAGERLAPLLRDPRWGGLVGHVLVEMLLDRWLMERDPGLVERYYTRFAPEIRDRAADLATHEPDRRHELAALLERFVELKFLADYVTFEGLCFRFVRTLGRVEGCGVPEERMSELVRETERLYSELEPGSAELLADVAAAIPS